MNTLLFLTNTIKFESHCDISMFLKKSYFLSTSRRKVALGAELCELLLAMGADLCRALLWVLGTLLKGRGCTGEAQCEQLVCKAVVSAGLGSALKAAAGKGWSHGTHWWGELLAGVRL